MARTKKQSTEAAVREIRRKTRRKFAPEEKVRIVLEGLRGEQSISELCRREGIASNLYYRWSKDFLEAGKKQLAGDTVREATSDEVKDLRDTYASSLLTAGVQLGYVSSQLGYADVAVTARHYAKWIGGDVYREPFQLRPGDVPADFIARSAYEFAQSPPPFPPMK